MPSTYTLNNGIELIGTGEQSGTWGSTTNTNLELLDTALDGQVTVTLSSTGSSGSPNALPISDGSNSDGRNRLIIFNDGSDLGGTAYVQLTPNDAEKIIYVRNSLSGSRSILLFQGTYNASNDYEVPAGTTAVVFFNGAGSGAVAANVFNNAHFDALNVVGSVTVGGGVTVTGTVDAGTVEFDNLSGTGAVSVTNILDEDNMASNSATALSTQQSIKAYVDAQVGTVDTLAEILANGNTTGGNDIVFSAGDNITNASGDLTLDVAGDISLDAAGDQINFKSGGTPRGYLDMSTGGLILRSLTADADIILQGNDGGSAINALTLDMSAAGAATFNAGVTLTGTLNVDSSTTNGFLSAGSNILNFGTSSNDTVAFYANNTEHMKLKPDGEVIINETGGAEGDLRVESDSNSHMLFVDAGTSRVGINKSSPSGYLHILGSNDQQGATLYLQEANNNTSDFLGTIYFGNNTQDNLSHITSYTNTNSTTSYLQFNSTTTGSVRRNLDLGATAVVLNEDSADIDFRVESDTNTHMLFVDAGSNVVGLGTSSTTSGRGEVGVGGMMFFEPGGTAFNTTNPRPSLKRGGDGAFQIAAGSDADSRVQFYTAPSSGGTLLQRFVVSPNGDVGVETDVAASTNSVTNPGKLRIRGYGWDTARGSRSQGWALESLGTYSNPFSGQVYPTFNFQAKTSDDAFSDTTVAGFVYESPYYKFFTNGGAVFNEGSYDQDFRVESNNYSSCFKVDAGNDTININSTTLQNASLSIAAKTEGTTSNWGQGGYTNLSLAIPNTVGAIGQLGFVNLDSAGADMYCGIGAEMTNGGGVGLADLVFFAKDNGSNVASKERMRILGAAGHVVINDQSYDQDFRVESDGNSHAIFVDGAQNTVGIGTSSTFQMLTVNGNIAVGGAGNKGIYFGDNITSSADQEWLLANNASSSNSFILYEYDSGSYVSQRVEFLSGGNTRFDNGTGTTLVINEAGNNADFRVESDSVSDMFVVDGGTNCVNIGAVGSSTTTNYSLFVRGNNAESGTNTYYVQKIGASNYSDSGQYTALIGLGVEPNAAWAKGAIGWRRSSSYDRGDMVFLVNGTANNSTASNSDERMRINSAGVVITGNLAKSSGSFKIDHPLPEKTETHHLIHSFVESPQADNIYRGKVDLVAGQATVNIDTVAGMTDGTFATLNREIQCFTSNETGWTAVRGSVSGNILTIEAQDNTCTDTVSWLVVGERQDQHMYDTDWTDDNGKVIVEPLKENA